jgi:hypothetical protein
MSSSHEEKLHANIRVDEFRLAIHQTHDCEAGRLAEIVHVSIPRKNGSAWEGLVHAFEICGHRKATRCYAWPEPVNDTTIIIRVTLHSEKISSAQKAVQSVIRSRQTRPS